jgi:large subunit ribosomal protein L32
MAVPKRRHSSTRGKKRRTHWKARTPGLSVCSHCGQPKLPHRACPQCGYYKGEEVATPKAE